MTTPKVFDSEYNFCLVLWECEPITALDIAKICKERLSEITFTGTGTSPKSEIFKFEYDSYGNVTKTLVGNKAISTKTYGNDNGILQSEAYGNGDQKNYSYNNLGLVSSITSVNNGTSKTSYSWGYNSVGTVLYHRDAENNLKYLYDYDSLGRVIRQKIQTNYEQEIS